MAKRAALVRDLLVVAGAAAAGFVAGRATATRPHPLEAPASSEATVDALLSDHRRFIRVLDAAAGATTAAQRAALFATVKRELVRHAVAEEIVIYPHLSTFPELPEEARRLSEEHRDMTAFLAEIERTLERDDPAGFVARIAALREAIRNHVAIEEQRVFPRVRAVFEERRRAEVNGKAARA